MIVAPAGASLRPSTFRCPINSGEYMNAGRRGAAKLALDRTVKCHYGTATFPRGRLKLPARRSLMVRQSGFGPALKEQR
jgi:hypothetical protein